MTTIDDRESRGWAMVCHLTALCGSALPFGHLIVPLIVWILKKEEYPFVDRHGRESLNFQISMTIYFVIAGLLIFIAIGIPIMILLGIFEVVMIIIASIRAYNGEEFKYPFTIRFL